MAIKTDRSDLPEAEPDKGELPDTQPRFIQLLVEKLAARDAEGGDKATAFGTRLRHSDAGACARRLGYKAAGFEVTDPFDLPATWVTSMGTMLHERWQEALQEAYPEAEVEAKLRIDGLDASGHADAIVYTFPVRDDGIKDYEHPHRILYELKTTGGYAYKLMIGERGVAQGPKHEHKLQAALNGLAVDADEIIIGYLSNEAVSKNLAARAGLTELGRFAAEWSYTREEYEPWARSEVRRMTAILAVVDGGKLPKRIFPTPELPKGHEITDPAKGAWQVEDREHKVVDVGLWWACGYCPYQSLCVTTRPGRIDISEVQA